MSTANDDSESDTVSTSVVVEKPPTTLPPTITATPPTGNDEPTTSPPTTTSPTANLPKTNDKVSASPSQSPQTKLPTSSLPSQAPQSTAITTSNPTQTAITSSTPTTANPTATVIQSTLRPTSSAKVTAGDEMGTLFDEVASLFDDEDDIPKEVEALESEKCPLGFRLGGKINGCRTCQSESIGCTQMSFTGGDVLFAPKDCACTICQSDFACALLDQPAAISDENVVGTPPRSSAEHQKGTTRVNILLTMFVGCAFVQSFFE